MNHYNGPLNKKVLDEWFKNIEIISTSIKEAIIKKIKSFTYSISGNNVDESPTNLNVHNQREIFFFTYFDIF